MGEGPLRRQGPCVGGYTLPLSWAFPQRYIPRHGNVAGFFMPEWAKERTDLATWGTPYSIAGELCGLNQEIYDPFCQCAPAAPFARIGGHDGRCKRIRAAQAEKTKWRMAKELNAAGASSSPVHLARTGSTKENGGMSLQLNSSDPEFINVEFSQVKSTLGCYVKHRPAEEHPQPRNAVASLGASASLGRILRQHAHKSTRQKCRGLCENILPGVFR